MIINHSSCVAIKSMSCQMKLDCWLIWGHYGFAITLIPFTITFIHHCCQLDNNSLTMLPSSIGNLTNLTFLNVRMIDIWDDAMLTSFWGLPQHSAKLAKWDRSIDKLDRALGMIDDELMHCDWLIAFQLDRNKLTSIPSEIGNLQSLRNLDVWPWCIDNASSHHHHSSLAMIWKRYHWSCIDWPIWRISMCDTSSFDDCDCNWIIDSWMAILAYLNGCAAYISMNMAMIMTLRGIGPWRHCSMRWRSVMRFESCWWQMVEMAACLKWFHNTSSMPFGHTLNQCGSMAWWSQHEINEWNDAAIERWAADGMIRSSQQWMKQNESWRNHFIRHSSAVEPRSAHW